jgi:hypothetical protein
MRLALRGSQGLRMVQGPPDYKDDETFPSDKSIRCKVCKSIGIQFLRTVLIQFCVLWGILIRSQDPIYG